MSPLFMPEICNLIKGRKCLVSAFFYHFLWEEIAVCQRVSLPSVFVMILPFHHYLNGDSSGISIVFRDPCTFPSISPVITAHFVVVKRCVTVYFAPSILLWGHF